MDFDYYREKFSEEGLKPSKPNSWKAIKAKAIKYRNDWLENVKENSDGKNYPKNLNEIAVATGMNELLHVITLDNGKVAIYDPESGYYQKDYKYAYKIIHLLQPTFNETKARNVLFLLSSMDREYTYNGMRVDFEPEYRDIRRFILVKNGIYDKRKRELLPFDYKFINFSTIETKLVPNAKPPVIGEWQVDEWLLDLMSGDKELVNLLWQVISASLNGNYSYRKSIWFIGNGNDGKGTFQQMISNLVGFKNVAPLKINQFSERFGLAIIEGKTVIIGDDVQAGIYVDESSNFNSVVTGEPVSIEKKGENPYMAIFKKTVIQSTNAMPSFKNKSNGTYRRIIIIPFLKTFSAKDDDWAIKDDYINRPEVLEYVLWKSINLDFERFSEPKATEEQMKVFKKDNNTVLAFVEEWFDDFESTALPTRFLWWLYKEWCKENGYTALKKTTFEKELASNISDDWILKTAKIKGKFFPGEDAPTYYSTFPWNNEKDPQKAFKSYCKR
ncbi:TPA: DNA primase [Streptococcus agalactiae]|nr:DNA primase [Streptococcus agalactiae]